MLQKNIISWDPKDHGNYLEPKYDQITLESSWKIQELHPDVGHKIEANGDNGKRGLIW